MLLQDLYKSIREELKKAGLESPDLEARLIVGKRTGHDWAALIGGRALEITEEQTDLARSDVRRRLAGEPISRIHGERAFWGMDFKIGPDTLDPRPDTETLVEAAVKACAGRPPETILDLGTGSGCILVALLTEFPQARGVGIDRSHGALQTARINALRHNVGARARFVCADWVQGLSGRFDLIVSNPPYIARGEIESLAPEVRNHDPILALEGGEDGLEAYKNIFMGIKDRLNPGAKIFLEIGFGQEGDVRRLAKDSRIRYQGVHRDLAGVPRVLEFAGGDN